MSDLKSENRSRQSHYSNPRLWRVSHSLAQATFRVLEVSALCSVASYAPPQPFFFLAPSPPLFFLGVSIFSCSYSAQLVLYPFAQ